MPKTYTISREEAIEIEDIRRTVSNKKINKRLHALQLRGKGMKNAAIAEKLDTSPKVVSRWVSAFCNDGIEALMGGKHGGNHKNMSFDEESVFLSEYKELAEQGQIIEVSEMKRAYEEKVGHNIGKSQIYRVLARHGWRKVMPRSKHPNKASNKAIEASKKLT